MIKTDKLSRPLFFRVREMISTGLLAEDYWPLDCFRIHIFLSRGFMDWRQRVTRGECRYGMLGSRESIITIIGSFDPTLWWYQPDTQILTGHSVSDNSGHENILNSPLRDTWRTIERWPQPRLYSHQYCEEISAFWLLFCLLRSQNKDFKRRCTKTYLHNYLTSRLNINRINSALANIFN